MTPPKIFVDLYRDLRDRRLLLPGLLLVVALVAVPVALSKSSSSDTSTSALSAGASGRPTAAEPAVLTENVGVRDYNKRLSTLKRKDPFKRHLSLPKLPGGNPGKLTPPTGTMATPSSSSVPPTVSPTPSATPTTTSTAPPPSSSSPTQSTAPSQTPSPGVHLYRSVVDLKIGTPDHLTKRTGVKALTQLPHDSNPVVALLGAELDRTKAEFLVSRNVDTVQGGSSCSPGRSDCQLLIMKPGGKAKLKDGTSGKTYVLKVLAIRLVQIRNAHGKSSGGGSGKSGASSRAGGGSRAFGVGVGG